MKYFLTLLLLFVTTNAWAVDTAVTYNSGILVLLFVGFCALLIVAQLIPALMVLFGIIKAVEPQRKAVKAK